MSGRIIRLAPRSVYDFNMLNAGGSTAIALAQRVDVSQYTELTLMVRVHGVDIGAGAGNLKVRAVPEGHTNEDPGQFFLDDSSATGLGEIALDNSISAPAFRVKLLSSGSGAMIAVLLEANQDQSQVYNLWADISVDLSMKE